MENYTQKQHENVIDSKFKAEHHLTVEEFIQFCERKSRGWKLSSSEDKKDKQYQNEFLQELNQRLFDCIASISYEKGEIKEEAFTSYNQVKDTMFTTALQSLFDKMVSGQVGLSSIEQLALKETNIDVNRKIPFLEKTTRLAVYQKISRCIQQDKDGNSVVVIPPDLLPTEKKQRPRF